MSKDFYTNIGYTFVWCVKYIFVPIIVAVTARIIVGKLPKPQPKRQKNKRP